jgi:hypothetical protein
MTAEKAVEKATAATRPVVVISQKPGLKVHLRGPKWRTEEGRDANGRPIMSQVRPAEYVVFERCVAREKVVDGEGSAPMTQEDLEAIRSRPGFGSEFQDGETLALMAKKNPSNFRRWLEALKVQAKIKRLDNTENLDLEILSVLEEFGYRLPRAQAASAVGA